MWDCCRFEKIVHRRVQSGGEEWSGASTAGIDGRGDRRSATNELLCSPTGQRPQRAYGFSDASAPAALRRECAGRRSD
jgi:hypothetical protein